MGLVEYQRAKYPESLELFKQAIQNYPANPSFYINLARSLEQLGRLQDALSVYREAANLDSDSVDAYLGAGLLCQRLQDYDLALDFFDKVIERDNLQIGAYLAKTSVLSVCKKYKEAIETIDAARALLPNSADLLLNLGFVFEERSGPGDLDLAIKAYSDAAALKENYSSAVFNRANVYQKLSRWELAVKDYQQVIEWDESFSSAFTNLGLAYYKQSNYDAAIESFQRALLLDPTHPQTYSNLGVVLYESDRFLEALAAYEKAIQFKPDYFEAFSNRGNVLKELRQFEAALESYGEAIALCEDYFEAYVNRGVVYFELDRLEEARADYDRAIEINPDYSLAHSNLANVMKERGQLDPALKAFQTAIELKLRQLKNQPLERFVVAQKPMLVQDASNVLLDLHSLLLEHSIPFFLAYGTLLGVYRDSELLPHDKDLDVGLDWNFPRDQLISILKHSGNYWIDPKSTNPSHYDFNFGVIEKRRGISIDFFFFKPEGDFLLSGFHHLPRPLLWRFNRFDWGDIKYKGRTFKSPSNPELFLTDIYGPEWRVPDPYFDSLVSGLNLTEESKPISLLYAHSRLFDYLMEQNWRKAYGYCYQIRTYLPVDPLMAELIAFLEPLI